METREPELVMLAPAEAAPMTFSAAGEILVGAEVDVEASLVYLLQDEAGNLHQLKPSEFNAFVASGQTFGDWLAGRSEQLAR